MTAKRLTTGEPGHPCGAGGLVLAVLLVSQTWCGAANYYLDNALTNSANTGTSWANAWTNLGSVALAAGDTLFVSGGPSGQSYGVLTLANPWANSETGRITVRCGQDAGHTGPVTFNQIRMGDDSGHSANYVTIDGSLNGRINLFINGGGWQAIWHRTDHETNNIYRYLDITTTLAATNNSQAHGIQLNSSANNTEIAFCRIHDCGQRGIREGGSTEWYMSRIKVHDCTFTNILDDPIITTYGLDFYNNTVNGLGCDPSTHPDGIQTDGGGMRVWNNVFHDETQLLFIETTANHLENVYVWNNVFYDSGPTISGRIGYAVCLMFRAKLPNPSSQVWSNIVIVNNTFHQMNPPLRIDSDTGVTVTVTNSLFANNIIADSPYSQMLVGTACTWADNGFPYVTSLFGPNSICWSGYSFYATPVALAAAHPSCFGNTFGQPQFADAAAHNYRLAGSSLSGTNLSALFATLNLPSTSDPDGNARAASGAWDVGAYAYVARTTALSPVAPPSRLRFVGP